MAFSDTNPPRTKYTVGGSPEDAFPTEFEFWDSADINVYNDGSLVSSADYTVTGGEGANGTVTLDTPVSDTVIIITRNMPIERASDFPVSSQFKISALNTALDKIIAMLQEQSTRLDRTISLADSDETVGLELPAAADRASKFLAFNSDGTAIVSTGVAPADVVVSAFGETLVGAADAAAARTLLDAPNTDAATSSAAGLVELSIDAENTTGTDATRAVTPAGLTNFAPATATIDVANDLLIVRDATDSKLKKMAPSGLVAQVAQDTDSTYALLSTQIPTDNTIPQSTEGDECLLVSITPKNASSTLLILVNVFVSANPGVNCTAALFKDSGADAIAAGLAYVAGNAPLEISIIHKRSAGSTSAQTFKVRVGSGSANPVQFNGYLAGAILGGAMSSSITVMEILP